MTCDAPKSGEIWEHFKGQRYEVLHVAFDVKRLDDVVVYRRVEGRDVYARPIEEWLERVSEGGVDRYVRVQ